MYIVSRKIIISIKLPVTVLFYYCVCTPAYQIQHRQTQYLFIHGVRGRIEIKRKKIETVLVAVN